jgi:hypothetical protein
VAPHKPVKRTRVGDLLAIPARDGRYFVAVVVDRNSFGTALGLFTRAAGRAALPTVPAADPPHLQPRPVYTGEDEVQAGRWTVIGHDEDLPRLFHAPEIYHRPADIPGLDMDLGQFGSAETPDHRLRQLTEAEADEVGLRDGTYRAIRLGDDLEAHLNETFLDDK